MKARITKRPLVQGIGLALVMGAVTGLATNAYARDVTWEDIENDAETTENVLGYGIGPKAQRYSPLTMVNTENVERLVPAYSFSFGDEKQRGQETQALVHDGIVYVTGSYSRLFALDARPSKPLPMLTATASSIWSTVRMATSSTPSRS